MWLSYEKERKKVLQMCSKMQYGYDDELFQDWRNGKIGEKDLPEGR